MVHWWRPAVPNERMTLRQLAQRVSDGEIEESDWICSDGGQQQVYDIPGLQKAVSRLLQPFEQRVTVQPNSESTGVDAANLSLTANSDSEAQQHSVSRRPLAHFVAELRLWPALVSVGFMLLAGWSFYHSQHESLRFPQLPFEQEVRYLPFVGKIQPENFWLVEGNLLLGALFFSGLSILLSPSRQRGF